VAGVTTDELRVIAERAFFRFDVDQQDVRDSAYMVVGDGVDDLDRLIALLEREPRTRVQIDTSASNSSWAIAEIDDVRELRGLFIGFYGTVNKTDEYQEPRGHAVQL